MSLACFHAQTLLYIVLRQPWLAMLTVAKGVSTLFFQMNLSVITISNKNRIQHCLVITSVPYQCDVSMLAC